MRSPQQLADDKYQAALARAKTQPLLDQHCSTSTGHGPHEWFRNGAFPRWCRGLCEHGWASPHRPVVTDVIIEVGVFSRVVDCPGPPT